MYCLEKFVLFKFNIMYYGKINLIDLLCCRGESSVEVEVGLLDIVRKVEICGMKFCLVRVSVGIFNYIIVS